MSAAPSHVWGTAPEFIGPRHELRERLLLSLLLSANPGSTILNAGAGQGTFTLALEREGFEVTSTDISKPAVTLLKEIVRGPVLMGDAVSLPFADGTFDAVVLGEVLEHIVEDDEALCEAARVLRPGGVVALSVPADSVPFGASDEWAGHVRRYSRARLLNIARLADLHVDVFRGWGFPASAFYHRRLYEPRLARCGAERATEAPRLARATLRAVLQVDRLFVGVNHGALGYLALCRKPASTS